MLLALDDLHLADAETLEFVADLAGWCRAAPLLVVGAFRNDGPGRRRRTPTRRGDAPQLVLGPLDHEAVADICQIYEPDGWTAEDVRRVAELSDGIPLLVHEQASTLGAGDRRRAGSRQATGPLAATRGRLLTSRGEVADGVEGIQRLLEQRRLQLAGREAQQQRRAVASLAGCPYKGLARFEPADAANFFGRERLVAELVARAGRRPACGGGGAVGQRQVVAGAGRPAAGAGGRRPRRRRAVAHGRCCARGGAPRPSWPRAWSVPAGAAPLAVFVDQFEETFTLGAEADEQIEFLDRLLALAGEPST